MDPIVGLCTELTNALEQFRMKQLSKHSIHFAHGEAPILHYLYFHKGELTTPSMLSNQMQVSRPSITSALNSLEKKEFIQREIAQTDRRTTYVHLTELGLSFIGKKIADVNQMLYSLVNDLGQEDTAELIRLLKRSFKIISEYDEPKESITMDHV